MSDIDESLIYIYIHIHILCANAVYRCTSTLTMIISISSLCCIGCYIIQKGCILELYPEIVGAQMSKWYRVCPATPRLRGAKGSEKSRLQMFILQRGPMKAGSVDTLQYDRLKTSRISTLTREIEEIFGKTFGTGLLQAERSNWWRSIGSVRGITKVVWIWVGSSNVDLFCVVHAQHPKLESIGRKVTIWKHEFALCPAAWFWGSATVIAYKIRQNGSKNSYSVTVIRIHQPKFRPKSKANFSSTTITTHWSSFFGSQEKKSWHLRIWVSIHGISWHRRLQGWFQASRKLEKSMF